MTSNATDPLVNTPGHLSSPDRLVNIPRLVTAFYANHPDPAVPAQRVSFGTSGHRGSSLNSSFNDAHILAITQAIVEYRASQNTTGPLFLAQDTHALSEPAFATALEVLAANGVEVMIDQDLGYTPTPALSHAILTYNSANAGKPLADGIVITPSHNPPEDGGFKYNPPNGGPADTTATKWIENRANELIADKLQGVKRLAFAKALARRHHSPPRLHHRLRQRPRQRHRLRRRSPAPPSSSPSIPWAAPASPTGRASPSSTNSPSQVLNPYVDPTFRFMTLDWDGRIRMDCSSPFAMASMIANKDHYDVAWACDTDHDRHGIVTRSRRPAQPQPLPRRVHPISLHPPPRVVRKSRHRQDAGLAPASSTASPKASTAPCSKSP